MTKIIIIKKRCTACLSVYEGDENRCPVCGHDITYINVFISAEKGGDEHGQQTMQKAALSL
jgi:rRNA maturation endonuclease Nob1